MSSLVKIILASTLSLLIAGFVFFKIKDRYSQSYTDQPSLHKLEEFENQGVPDFTTKRLSGAAFEAKKYSSQVRVINFWATWCAPCLEELPSLQKLALAHPNLTILAISVGETPEEVKSTIKSFGKFPANFHFILDQDQSVAQLYGVHKIPESFLVKKSGKLARKVVNSVNWMDPEFQNEIQFLEKSQD